MNDNRFLPPDHALVRALALPEERMLPPLDVLDWWEHPAEEGRTTPTGLVGVARQLVVTTQRLLVLRDGTIERSVALASIGGTQPVGPPDFPLDLFAPGWIFSMEDVWEWDEASRFLRRLATFSRLILYDRRGTGRSDHIEDPAKELTLDLVVDDGTGAPWHPDRLTAAFRRLPWQVGVSATLHGLRRTYGSLSLKAGVPLKVVSEQLGHASIAITADIYTDVYPELRADAARKINDLLEGGLSS